MDYSHKIGRLMAHAFIAFYHGPGLPILYVFFFVQLGLFLLIEKALMLRYYRKLIHFEAYIRQYLIHVLLLMLMFHFFRTIDVLGSEEIFPSSYSETIGLKSGTLTYYYEPHSKTYGERLILPQGIGYFLFALIVAAFYIVCWWTHRQGFFLSKCFSLCAILSRSSKSPILHTTLKNRNLAFYPDTYKFDRNFKYREALPRVDTLFGGSDFEQLQANSPENSHLDSQYDLKSEANSGDDVLARKQDTSKQGVFNIYKKPDMNNQHDRINSDELEEEKLD